MYNGIDVQQLDDNDIKIIKNYSNGEIITYILKNCITERNKSKKLFELLHDFFENKRDFFVDNTSVPNYLDTYNPKNFKREVSRWKKSDDDKNGRSIPEKVKQAISDIFNLPYNLWKIDKSYSQRIKPIYVDSEGGKLRAVVQFYYKDDKQAFFDDFDSYLLEYYELAKCTFVKPNSALERQDFFKKDKYDTSTKEALRRFILEKMDIDFLNDEKNYIDKITSINSIEYNLLEAEAYFQLGLTTKAKCIVEHSINNDSFLGDPQLCNFFSILIKIECNDSLSTNPKCLEYINQYKDCKNKNSFKTGYFDCLVKGRLSIDIDFETSLKYTLKAIELQPTLLFAYNNLLLILVANNKNIYDYRELLEDQFEYFFKKRAYNKEALIFDDLIKIVKKVKRGDFLKNNTKLIDELNSWHAKYKKTKIGKFVLPDYTIGVDDINIKMQILFLVSRVKDMRVELRTNNDLKTLINLYKN